MTLIHRSRYFEWLGIYTRSLIWPSLMGLAVFVWGIVDQNNINPDYNVLTVPSSEE